MITSNNKISVRQMQKLLILDVFGAGVTTLPRLAAGEAAQDGWVSVILATGLALAAVYVITTLAGMFPGKNFVEYSGVVCGKPLGTIISTVLVIKIALNCGFQLRFFGEIVRETLLYSTPFYAVCLAMLLLGAYAASKGYEARARMGEVLIYITLAPLLLVLAIAACDVDFTNLMPALTATPTELGRGALASVFAFNGIELLLLVFPYVTKPERIRRGALAAVGMTGALMAAVTLLTIARYGPESLRYQLWPVLELMDTVDIPGSLVERQEALIMSFWIISTFAAINAGLFFSSLTLKDIAGRGKHSWYIAGMIPVIFGAAWLPGNLIKTFEYIDLMNMSLSAAFLFVIPLLMLITAKIRRLGGSGR